REGRGVRKARHAEIGCSAFSVRGVGYRMAHFKTLKAWQHAERLAIDCVRTAKGFPDYEQSGLADQLRRACYSVPLNIAEGNTRYGSRDARRFFDTARGSLAEVETILGIARQLGYITPAEFGR